LAAIVFTDIVGFSKISSGNEVMALELLTAQKQIVQPLVQEFGGQWLKEMGDGLLLSFPSSYDAVRCAVRIQKEVRQVVGLVLRIGIHQGDVVQTENDVLGSGVNIASRVETVSPAGGIAISDKVQRDIAHHADLSTQSIGFPKLKGIDIEFEVFCVTNDGLPVGMSHGKVEITDDASEKKSAWPILAALLVFVFGVLTFLFLKPGYSVDLNAIPSKSIAVLPFDNFAKGASEENFADGLTEVITATLSKIGDMKVISRTSVMAYKGNDRPTSPEIARELNVAHVLEGSVQRVGDQVRIVVQLIDAREDKHIWAETFDGKFSELFDVQTQVATNIANYLKSNLTVAEQKRIARRPTENAEAYEQYLVLLQRGIVHIDKKELDLNLSLSDKVLSLDADFAEAYAIKALAHLGYYWSGNDRTDGRLKQARELVDKAVTLAPEAPMAHTAKGYLHYWGLGEFDAAIKEFETAQSMEPGSSQHIEDLAWVQRAKGNIPKALATMEKALELNPQSDLILREMGFTYTVAKRWDDALRVLDRALIFKPDSVDYRSLKVDAIWSKTGDTEATLTFIHEAQKVVGEEHYLHHKNKLLLDSGRHKEALVVIGTIREEALLSQSRIIPMALARAFIHERTGDTKKMNKDLDSAQELLIRMANKNPIDARIQLALGVVHAMRGEKEAALMRGKQAVALYPLEKNKINAQRIHVGLAKIYLRLGMNDECIQVLETVKNKPLGMEVGEMKTDKTWDVIRDHPTFRAIVD